MEEQIQKEIEWKESIKIPDGKHTGTITKIVYKDTPYEYTDVLIALDDLPDIDAVVELKYGCPTVLSEGSKLGRLLVTFGSKYEKGAKLDVAAILKGKKVELMTLNKKSSKDGKEYAEIVEDSVKPI